MTECKNKKLFLIKKLYEKQIKENNLKLPDWQHKLKREDWQCFIIQEVAKALNNIGFNFANIQNTQNLNFELLEENIKNLLSLLLSKAYYFDAINNNNTDDLLNKFSWSLCDDKDIEIDEKDKKEFIKYKLLEIIEDNTERQFYALSALISIIKGFDFYYQKLIKERQ